MPKTTVRQLTLSLKPDTHKRLKELVKSSKIHHSVNTYVQWLLTSKPTPILHTREKVSIRINKDAYDRLTATQRRSSATREEIIEAYLKKSKRR